MQSKHSAWLRPHILFVLALLTYLACSDERGGKTYVTPGDTAAGSTSGDSTTTGGQTTTGDTTSGSTTTGPQGAGGGATTGDTTTGPGSGGVGMGGGTTTGGGGMGGAPPVNDPTCMAYTSPRANRLSPVDAQVATLLQQMTTPQKLAIENGDPTVCGAPNWNCDFDGTGMPSTNPVITPFKMRDGPRGVHNLSNGATTTWAIAEARAASFDDDLEYRVGQKQGIEMRALKFDLSLSPVVNTLRHPAWARAQETYGEDPVLLGRMGAAFTNGLQQSVPACPKHFVGNDTDNNRQSVIVTMDEQTLRENYALPFQILVEKSDPGCIMAAYNGVNGEWSTENKHLMIDILRTDWKWTGFVVSDWWATKNNGVKSFNAGLDYEMPDKTAFQQIPAAVGSTVTQARVDEAATRILNVRIKFGQFTSAYNNSPLNTGIVNDQTHKDLARETAEKGAVLLKNDGALPLGPKATTVGTGLPNAKSVIFLGPDRLLPNTNVHAAGQASGLGDRGSSDTTPPYAISFIQGLKSHPAAAGWTITDSANAADASKADVAIIPVTMAHEDEGEAFDGGRDRTNLTLDTTHPIHWGATKPSAFIKQAAMAAPNTKIIVLLAVGSAVVMEDWWGSAHGIIETFYPGQEGGTALARLVFGDINFSGKLPFTVATNPNDYPAFQNGSSTATTDYFHGYRKIEKDAKTPRFWFGYGLSYTKFEYSNLQVLCTDGVKVGGRLNVQVTVKNTGTVAGDEIVQLYIGYPSTTARRPVKELKSYARVSLAPGESKNVVLTVAAKDMAYWNIMQNKWVIETVQHKVLVGPSANPASLLSANFTIIP
jgi:beta-glucosidase